MANCIFCSQSRKSCQACGQKVCARHVCTSNGCCARCLEANQQNALDGRCTTLEEDEQLASIGGDEAGVYGEITTVGFRGLAKRLQLGASDTYVDLGSGLGRTVFQAVSEFNVLQAVGIELAGSRHELAQHAAMQLSAAVASRVLLVHGDCSANALWEAGGACSGVSVVFAASLFFGHELMLQLARCVEACDSCRVVATLKRWDDGEAPVGFREQADPEVCETTWTAPVGLTGQVEVEEEREPGCPVHIYRRE